MVDRVLELMPAVVQTLSNMGTATPVEFSARDWELMKKVVRVLKPFKEATEWLSKSDASIALAIPIVTAIRKSLEVIALRDLGVMGMKRGLTDAMDKRFSRMEGNFHYAAATLLDSKYKHYFFRDSACVVEVKEYIVDKIAADLGQEEAQRQQVNTLQTSKNDC